MSNKEELENQKAEAALAQIKEVWEDKVATINGRDYEIQPLTHFKRKQVFAYYTGLQYALSNQDFGFLVTKEFGDIEKIISESVMYEGELVGKRAKHWDEFPEDYMMFITTMLGVISYPFLRGMKSS